MDLDLEMLRQGLLRVLVLICSLALHEWGHAFVADRLGDDTPRSQGRVTLNPLAHIDWIGTVLIPLLGVLGFFGGLSGIGWAKPVYTNPANFRRGMSDQALVTIAGPAVNFLLALLATFAAALAYRFAPVLLDICRIAIVLNVSLVVFNLLPIPPLDGSKFLMYWFGMSEETYRQLATYGSFVLLVLINLRGFRLLLSEWISWGLIPFDRLLIFLT